MSSNAEGNNTQSKRDSHINPNVSVDSISQSVKNNNQNPAQKSPDNSVQNQDRNLVAVHNLTARVIDFDNNKRNDLSEVAQTTSLGSLTESSLNNNLSQFKKEINSFKQNNNIRYQDREGINTEADYLNKAAEGSPDFDLFDFDDTDDDLFENEDNAIDFDKMVRDDPQGAMELMFNSPAKQSHEIVRNGKFRNLSDYVYPC